MTVKDKKPVRRVSEKPGKNRPQAGEADETVCPTLESSAVEQAAPPVFSHAAAIRSLAGSERVAEPGAFKISVGGGQAGAAAAKELH